MTVVGKILVFLNLVFSLVVGGFAVVDYASRTHWAKAFNDVSKQNKDLVNIASSYKADAERAAKEKSDLYEQLNVNKVFIGPAVKDDPNAGRVIADKALEELRSRDKSLAELRITVESMRKQLEAEKSRNVAYQSMERAMKTDTERRVADTKLVRDSLNEQMQKNFSLQEEKNDMRDKMIAAVIKADTLQSRNTQLEAEYQKLAKSNAQIRANAGGAGLGGRGDNPPPEDIEGQVTKTEGRLVSISVGSDNGLAKDQTMQLFRMGANARYIGKIRLVAVQSKTAVGEVVGRPTMSVQVGDTVASRIMGSR